MNSLDECSPTSFRFISLNQLVARTETSDGTLAASDICSLIGSARSKSRRGPLPISIGDEGFENVNKSRMGRPLKRRRVEPTIVWAGSTLTQQLENADGQRSLYQCGRGDVVSLSLPATPRSCSALVDCRRMTYSSARSATHVAPYVGPSTKERVVKRDLSADSEPRRTQAEVQRQERQDVQQKSYAMGMWSKLHVDGMLEVAAAPVDGMPSLLHSGAKYPIEEMQRRLCGDTPIVGELHEPNAELIMGVHSLRDVAAHADLANSAVRYLMGVGVTEETKHHEITPRRIKDRQKVRMQRLVEEYTTSAKQTIATASNAGCFSCLLPQHERAHLRTDRAARSSSQTQLLPLALQTLTRPYLSTTSSKQQRQVSSTARREDEGAFRFFWKHWHALGVIKTPVAPRIDKAPLTASSLTAKVRSAAADFTFSLSNPNSRSQHGDHTEELPYVEAIAAYNQLMSSSRSRGELLLRMRAVRQKSNEGTFEPSSLDAMSADDGIVRRGGVQVDGAAVPPQSAVSVHSASITDVTGPASSIHAPHNIVDLPLLPFVDPSNNSRSVALPSGHLVHFTLHKDIRRKGARSLHPGMDICGAIIDSWIDTLTSLRQTSNLSSPAKKQEHFLPVKVVRYASSQRYSKRLASLQNASAVSGTHAKFADDYLTMSELYHASINAQGEGLWHPVAVHDGHWIVVAFFANFNKTMTKCKPSLEVYDTLGARTSDEETLKAIGAVERMLRAALVAQQQQHQQPEKNSDSHSQFVVLAQSILGVPWRIRFIPEASMVNYNDSGLICMQRLTLALLPNIHVERVSQFVTRKSIEFVLLAEPVATSATSLSHQVSRLHSLLS